MESRSKKLLILGAFAQLCDIVEDAKSKGIYVIVTDYLSDSPAKKIADESFSLSITDVKGIVDLCRNNDIDGVMNYCIDPGQKPYQQICAELDIPCYGTKEQFDVMTNKDLFKRECIANDIDVIPSYPFIESFKANILPEMEFPFIVKPADGRASKGVTICYDASEIEDALTKALDISTRKKIIIEKLITGQEVVVKYFVRDGEIALTSMADLYTCNTETGDRAYICMQIFPSKHYQHFLHTTDEKIRAMIKNLGIKNGPLSFDGFFDGEKFRFFDPSFRMGGAQDWRIVARITGINISELLTEFALSGSIRSLKRMADLDGKFASKSSAMLYFLAREGKIGEISGIEHLKERPDVIGYHLSHKVGDRITQIGTSDHVVMRVLLVCESIEKLIEEVTQIRNIVNIRDDVGGNMLLKGFDLNLLKNPK